MPPPTTSATSRRSHLPYQRIAAAGHAALVGRPRATAMAGRVLTAPGLGPALAGGWGIFWNELVDGAAPGGGQRLARAATVLGQAVTAGSGVSRWFTATFDGGGGNDGRGDRSQSVPRPPAYRTVTDGP